MWYALARAAIAVWRQGHAGAAAPAPPPAGSGLSDKQDPAYLTRGRHVRGRYARPLSIVAPSFSQHPASTSRTVGQQAQFLAVVQGTGPVTVRWKKNGSVVATTVYNTLPATAIYTTPVLVLGDNASQFTAEASNTAGATATSQIATLGVTAASTPAPAPTPAPPGKGKHVTNGILDGLSLEVLTERLTQMQLAYLDLASGAKPQVVSYSQADGSKSVSYTQADLGRLAQAIKAVQQQIDAYNGLTNFRRRPMRPLF